MSESQSLVSVSHFDETFATLQPLKPSGPPQQLWHGWLLPEQQLPGQGRVRLRARGRRWGISGDRLY